jgi:hypothetical protein
MEVIIERCCGLDVHQETGRRLRLDRRPGRERPRKEIRTFRTMTRDLEALRDWPLHFSHLSAPPRLSEQ